MSVRGAVETTPAVNVIDGSSGVRTPLALRLSGTGVRQSLGTVLALGLLAVALGRHVAAHLDTPHRLDLGSIFWVLFYGSVLFGFVRRAWHGLGPGPAAGRRAAP
ncbi:MAG: hypothetical protein ACRDT4_05780 [Micromonosporaceae bacterium]